MLLQTCLQVIAHAVKHASAMLVWVVWVAAMRWLIVALEEIEQLQKRWNQHDACNLTVVLLYELIVDILLRWRKTNGSWSLLYLRRWIPMVVGNHQLQSH